MPAIYPYGGSSPTRRDPLTGTGWTGATSGGATVAWTAGTRVRASVPASTVGYGEFTGSAFVLTKDSWDVAIRIQVVTGDTSAQTRISLAVGKDSSNTVNLGLWGDGTFELGRVEGGSYGSASWSAGPTAGQRTGGQLWLRLSNVCGVVRAMWGEGSDGNPPSSWTIQYAYANTTTPKLTNGTFVKITPAYTIDTSVSAGYVVDVLDIRSSSVYPISFS